MRCPMWMTDGLSISFRDASAATVVPLRWAMSQSVSPPWTMMSSPATAGVATEAIISIARANPVSARRERTKRSIRPPGVAGP